MGLILDSSVLIAAERKGSNARQLLSEIAGRAAGEDVAFSVVTLIELANPIRHFRAGLQIVLSLRDSPHPLRCRNSKAPGDRHSVVNARVTQ
jgi:predicted nucleic acid-binding protein